MRAKLINATRPSLYEWLIVSRWGSHGENLSISWTFLPAHPGGAPLHLAPRQTALAVSPERASGWVPETFVLIPSLPERARVAGDFVPAEGYVHLYGGGMKPRLRSEGKCLDRHLRPAWHVVAARVAWIGEFLEGIPAVGG
jgi:hypothetical protein